MAERMNPLDRVLVITPTYNEAENIEPIITRLKQAVPTAQVLIVDDNSPDGTGAIADRLAATDPSIHVLHRPGKGGLAAAYLAGFEWGLLYGFDVLIQMDADGSHQPEVIYDMLAAMRRQGADMVKGSRWIKGGSTTQSKSRELLSRSANLWIQLVMDLPVRDSTGGFNAFRAPILRAIDLSNVASKGYTFQVDITRRVLEAGGKVVEVPIHFPDREAGVSKMSGSIIGEALMRTTEWGIDKRRTQLKGVGAAVKRQYAKVKDIAKRS